MKLSTPIKNFSPLTPTRRGAFTLIELLVVIAIIQSNLKQIGLGILQYVQDYDERYPVYFINPPSAVNGQRSTWFAQAQPYLKSTQLFVCPSDSETNQSGGVYWMPAGVPAYHVSYGYSANFAPGNVGINAATLTNAASTVMVTDMGTQPGSGTNPANPLQWAKKKNPWILDDYVTSGGNYTESQVVAVDNSAGDSANYGGPNARHLETCNVLWADGHVKAQRVNTFYNNNALSNCLRVDQSVAGTECK